MIAYVSIVGVIWRDWSMAENKETKEKKELKKQLVYIINNKGELIIKYKYV